MKFVADLHLHSHFSVATSKNLDPEHVAKWAQLKGVDVVGAGDVAHPGWLEELREKLEPAEEGMFRLKQEYAQNAMDGIPKACRRPVRFLLGGEISNIYKKHDRVRKNHNLVFVPDFDTAARLQGSLEKVGNIRSDGRPILGLDARDLLEITLETGPRSYFIPAHIWTPWFSLFGSKSGFDTIEECFEDLTDHLFAMETGLSSDPPMNWRLSALDNYVLVSNSDAHSPGKLAREANLFDTELSYSSLFDALHTGDPETCLGTLEFFPQEGKYHYDGHRKCSLRWDPQTTLAHDRICPVCGKPVTVGVMHRVESLADRAPGTKPQSALPFRSLIPLPEILSEIHEVGANTKTVRTASLQLLTSLGSELSILLNFPMEEIEQAGGPLLAEGIRRMRAGEVRVREGFDGEFGVITLFDPGELKWLTPQLSFLPREEAPADKRKPDPAAMVAESEDLQHYQPEEAPESTGTGFPEHSTIQESLFQSPGENRRLQRILEPLNARQREAAECLDRPLMILAGPGTGKTRTVTHRMAFLVEEAGVPPEALLAITFTNKAAAEMGRRLSRLLGEHVTGLMTLATFHALGVMILREEAERLGLDPQFAICSEQDRKRVIREVLSEAGERERTRYLELMAEAKTRLVSPDTRECREVFREPENFPEVYRRYEAVLHDKQAVDFEDLLLLPVRLFEQSPEVLQRYHQQFRWITVDEYQDINHAQYTLLRQLAPPETNLCVIGDPDQAIYGFRGASPEYFARFREDYPEAREISLTRNYRSSRNIVNASGQVIAAGKDSGSVNLWSDVVSRTKVDVYTAPTYKAEAEYVVHQVEKMVGGTRFFSLDSGRVGAGEEGVRSFGDFGVFYRVGAQSGPLAEAFHRSGIPFQTAGETPLYQQPAVQAVLACLWCLYNPESVLHLEKIVGGAGGSVEPELLKRLHREAGEGRSSLWETLQSLTAAPGIDPGVKRRMEPVLSVLSVAKNPADSGSVASLIEEIGEVLAAQDAGKFGKRALDQVRQLARTAAPFDHRLGQFLDAAALSRETDLFDPRADRVALLTLHASKGLEFPVVFIVGCEESLIPYSREGKTIDPEEERRLFYVGMTRAREHLILTRAGRRFLFGQTVNNPPSRFLKDIEDALKEEKQPTYRKPRKPPAGDQIRLFGDE